MSLAPHATQPGIWERIVQPQQGGLPSGAAEAILQMRLSEVDLQRVDELSEKARAGQLSSEETEELDNFLHVGRALEILKSKARQSLQEPHAA